MLLFMRTLFEKFFLILFMVIYTLLKLRQVFILSVGPKLSQKWLNQFKGRFTKLFALFGHQHKKNIMKTISIYELKI